MSSVVVSHFIMGLSTPDWVWIDLHSLYKLSVKLKKEAAKVPDESNMTQNASSPEECYCQILMLSLAYPTGLMQKEVPLVYHFIEMLFSLIGLSRNPPTDQQMQFAVLTDEDKPPFVQVSLHSEKDGAALYLDLTRLYKAFEKKSKFTDPAQTRFSSMHVLKEQENRPSPELFDYLEQRWSGIELHTDPEFSDRLDRLSP